MRQRIGEAFKKLPRTAAAWLNLCYDLIAVSVLAIAAAATTTTACRYYYLLEGEKREKVRLE